MLALTRQEKCVIVFFLTSLLIGIGASYFKKVAIISKTPSNLSTQKYHSSQAIKPININTAKFQALIKLKGIGIKTAERIIEYRNSNGPFSYIEDIQNVKGIGQKKFESIKEWITID